MINKKKKGRKRVGKAGRITGIVFFALQLLAVALVFYELIRFPILPKRIMAEVGVVFVLGLGVSLYALIIRKTRNSVTFGIIWAIIWIVACILGLAYIKPMRSTLKKVTGQEATMSIHIEGVSILVRAEDSASKISDTNGYTYGVQMAQDYANMVAAYDYIARNNNLKLTLREFDFYPTLAEALLSGEIRAMIVDTAMIPLLEENVEGFAGHYKILGELSFDTDIERSKMTVTPMPDVSGEPDPYGQGQGHGQGQGPGQTSPTPSEEPTPTEPVEPTGEPGPTEEVTATPTPEDTPTQNLTPTPTKVPATPTPVITMAPVPDRTNPKDVTEEYFTVYFSGIDCYGSITARSRSDVNIVMTVNPTSHKILLVTIPRDAYVRIPGVTGGNYDKLTHAGIYGVRASMNTLENVYGIKLDYYVRVNFSSVERFVDLLGGIDVYSAYAFSSRGTSFAKGTNHLNGKRALIFSRERKAFAAGDHQRGRNQMEVIKGIIAKIQSPAILNNFNGIMNTISGNVQTNLTDDQLLSLVRMQLDTGAGWSVETYSVSTSGGYEYCYSYQGMKLYVGYINWNTVSEASNKMRAVMAGN